MVNKIIGVKLLGIEQDGMIECINCIHEKEEDYVLDLAREEGGILLVGDFYKGNYVCSVCGQNLKVK